MALLDGKVAIVTGAGRGIGRGEALALARHGARVIVNDLGVAVDGSGSDKQLADEVVAAIAAAGGEAAASYENVSDWEGSQRIVRQAIDTWGQLDILVNNAGILRDHIIWNMTEEDWDAAIGVHLKGTFCMTRHTVAHWREQHKAGEAVYGRIINTTSAAMLGNPGQANYAAAKGGVAAFTLTVAVEVQRMGITCNAIRPSAATRMTQQVSADLQAKADAAEEKEFDPRDPVHAGEFVVYLASDAAQWISGQVFAVYGDTVHLTGGWHNLGSIAKRGSGWTAEELVAAMPKLAGMAPVSMIDQLVT
ncbi:MAG: SDR family oxidoreductase [Chloroflexi bacterium]|nr:SDR family oxidoreductase [Chloroflexota bacterium]